MYDASGHIIEKTGCTTSILHVGALSLISDQASITIPSSSFLYHHQHFRVGFIVVMGRSVNHGSSLCTVYVIFFFGDYKGSFKITEIPKKIHFGHTLSP